MVEIVVNGVTYDLDDLVGDDGRGYADLITPGAGGDPVPRYIAIMIDALVDATSGLVTTSASSVNIGVTDPATLVLDDTLPLFPGIKGQAVDAANPANYFYFTITTWTEGTRTAVVDVTSYGGTGTITNWNIVFGAGATGATGSAGTNGAGATAATATVAAYLDLLEGTNNGTNRVRFKGVDNLSANVDLTPPSATGTLLSNNEAATLTKGFAVTSPNAGTKSSGTFTPDPLVANMQYAVNGGAHTLAPPSSDCTMVIQYTNNGSAGAITTSGFTKVTGQFTTVNADDFMCYITKLNGFSTLDIRAMQ